MANTTSTQTDKPGYKSSEFWVTVVTSILAWLNMSGLLGAFQIPIEALGDLITLAISYVLGRTGIKAASDVATKIKATETEGSA